MAGLGMGMIGYEGDLLVMLSWYHPYLAHKLTRTVPGGYSYPLGLVCPGPAIRHGRHDWRL